MKRTPALLAFATLIAASLPLHAQPKLHRATEERPLVITKSAQVPGSLLFATTQAYGTFILHTAGATETTSIQCEGIPGISGVETLASLTTDLEGRAQVATRRILTHFRQAVELDGKRVEILIEQNLTRESRGTLTGNNPDGSLFPGTATFDQYILLSLDGRVLANREPLHVVATDVTSWPPVGSTFTLTKATDFYDVAALESEDPEPVATLDACAIAVREPVEVPEG